MAQEKGRICCPICWLRERYESTPLARHVRGIRRELLLTLRSILDARIERLTPAEPEPMKKVEVK